jgi:hypothetical protein
MRGAIPPLPNTSSWRGSEFSTGTAFPLPFTFDEIKTSWVGHIKRMGEMRNAYKFRSERPEGKTNRKISA